MIRLSKGLKPVWISVNQESKTLEYENAARGCEPSPWRESTILEALRRETNSKCMYCEGIIDDVSYAEVEHIQPKGLFKNLVLEWDNLGLVCKRCNVSKGAYWTDNASLQLLNPYKDIPELHIEFHGPMITACADSTRGKNTLRQLKFPERTDLLLSRARAIENINRIIELWAQAADLEVKELLADDVHVALCHDKEYSGTLRAFARSKGFPLRDQY
ncbi:HNH endonuclease [Arthrobacter sp. LS16]|uniref:HNH endonuclease n=1 Tax=Arthrobacter sp. 'calajunan' TaxID=1690248 RepID=UPI003C73B294